MDYHQHTIDRDELFDTLMRAAHGDDWRTAVTAEEQRRLAKIFNFTKLYGGRAPRRQDIVDPE